MNVVNGSGFKVVEAANHQSCVTVLNNLEDALCMIEELEEV